MNFKPTNTRLVAILVAALGFYLVFLYEELSDMISKTTDLHMASSVTFVASNSLTFGIGFIIIGFLLYVVAYLYQRGSK